MSSIKNNLSDLYNRIRECEKKFNRKSSSVSLLAVTKQQSTDAIAEAINAGQQAFGENYLQEALPKIAFFSEKNIEWHFIGPIQSNKTKKIAENFSWVHSLTSLKVAKRLNDQRPSHLPPLNVCIEVNVSDETTKVGADLNDITALAEYCMSMPKLKLRGLMAIPMAKNIFSEQRAEFHKLTVLYKNLNEKGFMLDTLSMGMSDDWEAAVAEEATMVRIGSAIFGKRN